MSRIAKFKFWLTGIPPRDEFDVCMCGSYMDDHNMGSGHSPVSVGDYCTRPPVWKRAFQAILCKFGRHAHLIMDDYADYVLHRCSHCQKTLSIDLEARHDFLIP